MPGLDSILQSDDAKKLLNNGEKLQQLLSAPETQQVFSMLEQTAGKPLEQASLDSAQLMSAMKKLIADPKGAELIRQMRSKLK